MKKILSLFAACSLAGVSLFAATTAAPAPAASASGRKIGDVNVKLDASMLSVKVSSSSPELAALAQKAFKSHGRYRLVLSGNAQFEFKFTPVSGTQVRVDILKGNGETVHSETVTGTSARNALLKAADVAVEKTNLLGLKGFFASRIAFISERTGKKEVYTSDLFFGEVRQITHDNAAALSPRWSPDGHKIIYTSFYKSGFPDVFVIDTASYQRSVFASFKGTNSGARFSPNGGQVAIILSAPGNPELYVGNSSGSVNSMKRLTRTDAVEASPCFSPDGSQIVYTSDAAGGPQLYVLPVGGGSPSRLVTNLSGYCAEPDWSRGNRSHIAFTFRSGRGYQIGMYDMGTRSAKQVSKAPYDGIEPSWLADGRHLVYTARTPGDSAICLLDTETGNTVVLSGSGLGQVMQASVCDPK